MSEDLHRLAETLETAWIGRPHEHHPSIGSTNDRALGWASQGAPHGALVTADRQTAGRGRRGRSWSSPGAEDIYASVLLRPRATPELAALSLVAGLGLREGLQLFSGEVVGLKWPNDLVAAGRKLGGILCETRWSGGAAVVVIGFGINVGRTDFGELASIGTSLALLRGGSAPSRIEVLVECLRGLEHRVDLFLRRGFPAMRLDYETHCTTLRREVEIHDDRGGTRRLWAERIDEDGALLVRAPDGTALERVESGDVTLSSGS